MASYLLIGGIDASIGTVVVGADPDNDNEPVWTNPNGKYPALVRVDDELMEATGGSGTAIISVNRGVMGTVAAAHDSGATLEDRWLPTTGTQP